MVKLYLHFPTRLHGVVFNCLSTETTLPYCSEHGTLSMDTRCRGPLKFPKSCFKENPQDDGHVQNNSHSFSRRDATRQSDVLGVLSDMATGLGVARGSGPAVVSALWDGDALQLTVSSCYNPCLLYNPCLSQLTQQSLMRILFRTVRPTTRRSAAVERFRAMKREVMITSTASRTLLFLVGEA
jgi:hypothetical protein